MRNPSLLLDYERGASYYSTFAAISIAVLRSVEPQLLLKLLKSLTFPPYGFTDCAL